MITGVIRNLAYACFVAGIIYGGYGLTLVYALVKSVVEDVKDKEKIEKSGSESNCVEMKLSHKCN